MRQPIHRRAVKFCEKEDESATWRRFSPKVGPTGVIVVNAYR